VSTDRPSRRVALWMRRHTRKHPRQVGLLAIAIVVGCSPQSGVSEDLRSGPIPPLRLSLALEPRRAELESAVRGTRARIEAFAGRCGWQELVGESFMDSVAIFGRKEEFDHALLTIAGMDTGTALPATYCAALENRVLLAVSPELYAENYPQGIEDRAYEKLLAHEISHRLHLRILGGNEEAMGPIWFFEGFATYAAGQFETPTTPIDTSEVWAIVRSEERSDYRRYASAFRFFAARCSLRDLIDHAGREDFADWLRHSVAQ